MGKTQETARAQVRGAARGQPTHSSVSVLHSSRRSGVVVHAPHHVVDILRCRKAGPALDADVFIAEPELFDLAAPALSVHPVTI